MSQRLEAIRADMLRPGHLKCDSCRDSVDWLLTRNVEALRAAEAAYLALLRNHDWSYRLAIQAELCKLRDFIAKTTDRTSQDVQEDFESRALLSGRLR